MIDLQAEQVAELWRVDGSLRDVYAEGMTLDRWRAFLEFTGTQDCRYTIDGRSLDVPSIEEIFRDRDSAAVMLAVVVRGAQVNCHFFADDDLELDIDPQQVQSPADQAGVIRFLEGVSAAIRRPLRITPENCPSEPYLNYSPENGLWTWIQ